MLFHAISYSTSVSDDIAAICKLWVILPWLYCHFTKYAEYIRILIHRLLSVVKVEDEVRKVMN